VCKAERSLFMQHCVCGAQPGFDRFPPTLWAHKKKNWRLLRLMPYTPRPYTPRPFCLALYRPRRPACWVGQCDGRPGSAPRVWPPWPDARPHHGPATVLGLALGGLLPDHGGRLCHAPAPRQCDCPHRQLLTGRSYLGCPHAELQPSVVHARIPARARVPALRSPCGQRHVCGGVRRPPGVRAQYHQHSDRSSPAAEG
jgi:hypothetical protein